MKLSFEQFAVCLGETESQRNREAWGDDGIACGEWQMHPVFVAEWFPTTRWRLMQSWHSVFYDALNAFYDRASYLGVSDVDAACGFHLHGRPDIGTATDCPEYAARFLAAVAKYGYTI